MAPLSGTASGPPKKPLHLLVLGIVLFGGGGVAGLVLLSQGKITTWLSALGVGATAEATYVRIVSWAGIVLGALCGWLLVRELRAKRARR